MCQRDRSATSTTRNNKVIVLVFFRQVDCSAFFCILHLLLLFVIPFQFNNGFYISVFFFLWKFLFIKCTLLRWQLVFYAFSIVLWYSVDIIGILLLYHMQLFAYSLLQSSHDEGRSLSINFVIWHIFTRFWLIFSIQKMKIAFYMHH